MFAVVLCQCLCKSLHAAYFKDSQAVLQRNRTLPADAHRRLMKAVPADSLLLPEEQQRGSETKKALCVRCGGVLDVPDGQTPDI